MKKTIISHFYNEEYILPWWLEHHKQIFDHGILIDYGSTDRSRLIIQKLCPTWEIVNSTNSFFDYTKVDAEINKIQTEIKGWILTLTTTEFLVGNIEKYLNDKDPIKKDHSISVVSFFDWNPDGWIPTNQPLWKSFHRGLLGIIGARKLHNYPFIYEPGRHYPIDPEINDIHIFKYNNCISSPEMVARRLQIAAKIPPEHKQIQAGAQHHNFGKNVDLHFLWLYHRSWEDSFRDLSVLTNNLK